MPAKIRHSVARTEGKDLDTVIFVLARTARPKHVERGLTDQAGPLVLGAKVVAQVTASPDRAEHRWNHIPHGHCWPLSAVGRKPGRRGRVRWRSSRESPEGPPGQKWGGGGQMPAFFIKEKKPPAPNGTPRISWRKQTRIPI